MCLKQKHQIKHDFGEAHFFEILKKYSLLNHNTCYTNFLKILHRNYMVFW